MAEAHRLTDLSPSAQRVTKLLKQIGHDKPVIMLPSTGKTSAEAAEGLGCTVAEIAKSIVFSVYQTMRQ